MMKYTFFHENSEAGLQKGNELTMMKDIQDTCIEILKEELIPAMGCTEPIAIAYCAAKLKEVLGAVPEKVLAQVSGNILKNVKSVVVPNTGGMKGIKTAIAAGVIAGKADQQLEVIKSVPEEKLGEIAEYSKNCPIEVSASHTPWLLDICLTGWAGEHTAMVHIANGHTNIVRIELDGKVLLDNPVGDSMGARKADQGVLNLDTILEFSNEVDLSLVKDVLDRQIEYNRAISKEGLNNHWGAGIGSMLLKKGTDVGTRARAWAAAGSDARMSGCELPVVIVSGSGNQGITASMPVVCYAEDMGASEEQLLRALIVSDLVTVYQKRGIGLLSAYCGAISAGVGAGAGIAYLKGADREGIAHTIINAVAILSGTICDGAKPSCAAKIASAVEAGIMGYEMYTENHNFNTEDGIIGKSLEETIANVGVLASQGMKETDRTIIKIMTQ